MAGSINKGTDDPEGTAEDYGSLAEGQLGMLDRLVRWIGKSNLN